MKDVFQDETQNPSAGQVRNIWRDKSSKFIKNLFYV